ncbi:hypothetical protein [Rhizobium rhizosphaerae]|uniref:hypothetical protein n=1 Tax=Xaviernesmea rhizosphaerae TaxID=1672749 RepID=UPI001301705F|nr:hypothetical protein [Xaviernesmea rhizosphaerae]
MILIIIWFAFALLFGFLTANMARRRGRDSSVWGILGFLFGIFAMILLFLAGDASTRAS